MIVIGERINGMFDDVKKALADRDAEVIKKLAKDQVDAGADVLDVNVGPGAADAQGAMVWLVECIQQVVSCPLSIDTTNSKVMAAGLSACNNPTIANSITGDPKKLEAILPLVAEHNSEVIGLTIDEKGIPRDGPARLEVAGQVLIACMEAGIGSERLYIDPVILPVKFTQPNPGHVLYAIREVKVLCDPPPRTIIGLSNVSQGSLVRELINRTFLAMALGAGLDGAIMDPLDSELMDAAITAGLLLNKQVYCDDYLKAYRKK